MLTPAKNHLHRLAQSIGVDIVRFPRWGTIDWSLQNILPTLNISLVCDVGAHYGEFGKTIRRLGYTGEMYSFEPLSQNIEKLRNASANDNTWKCIQSAVGRESGFLEINITASTDFASALLPRPDAALNLADQMEVVGTESVAVTRLDDFLVNESSSPNPPNLNRILLKSDTQGLEEEVLLSMGSFTDRLVAVQLELASVSLYDGMPAMNSMLSRMDELGFRLAGMFPISHNHQYAINEYDGLFLRRDA